MVEQITIENLSTGTKCSFGCDPSNMFLIKQGGIDFGKVSASHNTYAYPYQSGVSISSTDILQRTLSITGYACVLMTKDIYTKIPIESRDEYMTEKIYEKKNVLNQLINPVDEVRIQIGDFYIDGKPNNSVVYANTVKENNQAFCKFSISIFCYDPMFKAKKSVDIPLSASIPMFHFPLIIPQNEGIIMSERTSYHIISVQNDGQVTVGATFHIIAKGEVSGLTLENVLTGESIKINKTLSAGEEILIDTELGEERSIKGRITGLYSDYLKYWDYRNTWMQFPVGSSLLGYSVDYDKEFLVDISISLVPKVSNLKEQ